MVVDAATEGGRRSHPDRRHDRDEVRAFIVRSESPGDHGAIRLVHQTAFGRESEGRLVDALRQAGAFTPGMSLVGVEPGGEVVGHVLHSTIELEVDGVAMVTGS